MIGFGLSGRASASASATVWLMADMASGDGGFECDVVDADDCDVIDGGAFDSSVNFEDGTGLGRAIPAMGCFDHLKCSGCLADMLVVD